MQKLLELRVWLSGKKVYILLVLGALDVLRRFWLGDVAGDEALRELWFFAVGGASRAAVGKLK